MAARRTIEALQHEASRLLREYLQDNRTRTDLLKEVAEIIVELRARHSLEDGRHDWSGRSPAYRRVMHEVYAEAGVPEALLDTVQAALRYHVGNLLRQRADAGELESVGLTGVSPRERLQRERAVVNALAAVVDVRDGSGRVPDPVRVLAHAEALLELLNLAALGELSPEEVVALRMSAEEVRDRALAILHVLPKTRRRRAAAARPV